VSLAITVDPAATGGLRLRERQRPEPGPGEVLIEVGATSLNFGEGLQRRTRPTGTVLGWDAAGVVIAAGEGAEPWLGERVLSFGWGGGWAQHRVAEAVNVAAIPDGVAETEAAALPVAGVTAMQALSLAAPLLCRRVLVTGASGGVGGIAVQLARRAGAEVIASVGSAAKGVGLRELGADLVSIGLDSVPAPLDVVIDTVGGSQLAEVLGMLAPDGTVVTVGATSLQPTSFPHSALLPHRHLLGFELSTPVGKQLAQLLGLAGSKQLDPRIGAVRPWTAAAEAIDDLQARRVRGKIVFEVAGEASQSSQRKLENGEEK
jgi:NADPH:quinone reductase